MKLVFQVTHIGAAMIDILVYLFETYGYAEACPNEPDQLARKLAAAGFDEADIAEALDWLSGLRGTVQSALPPAATDKRSIRVFSEDEAARLDVASRSFLLFLCNTGVVSAHQRERIIERALALSSSDISISEFKVMVLMVLWQDKTPVDGLILDELMTEEVEGEGEDWGEAITVH